jgi:polysaccharide deacetylase family protein (PEP-CTERM system associated)
MKKAIISIDVEDWFHLDYFDKKKCNTNYSLLDGLDNFTKIISDFGIKANYFFLDDIAKAKSNYIKDLFAAGHDIGSHGKDHVRPLNLDINNFAVEIEESYKLIKSITDSQFIGYRAPCFSMDRQRLDILEQSGFSFDSSRINFDRHPLYGSIDMNGYHEMKKFIYKKRNFYEFEVTTQNILNQQVPISGGGYMRILPWLLTESFIKKYLKNCGIYILYIHPYELSKRNVLDLPENTSLSTKLRFNYGRNSTAKKLRKLINLLIDNDYEITTYSKLESELKLEIFK